MKRLIIVCGLTGAGKTSLVKELSERLNIAAIEKDTIKESLAEIYGCNSLGESKEITIPCIALLFSLFEKSLLGRTDIIIEGTFNFLEDVQRFKRWETDYNLQIDTVICHMDENIRQERFRDRPRHECHFDNERLKNINSNLYPFGKDFDYNSMPGNKIFIKTDRPVKELASEVINKIFNKKAE